MPGFFPSTGQTMQLGRVQQALFNNAVGSVQVSQRNCANYYGLANPVLLSSSFAGRFYPFTY